MAILSTVLGATLALTVPQDPGPSSTPDTVSPFHRAAAFPQNTAVLLNWNPDNETPWPRAIEALPRDLQKLVPQLMDSLAERAGLSTPEFDALRSAHVTVGAWRDSNLQPQVGWMIVVDAKGTSDLLVAALERAAGEPLDAGLKIASLHTPVGQEIAFGKHDETLLFGASTEIVEEATMRLEGAANRSRSVQDNVRFQRFLAQCRNDIVSGDSFAAAYVDISGLMDAWIETSEPDDRAQILSVRNALNLGQIYALGYFSRAAGEMTHEHLRICFPEPRTGIPALFAAEAEGALDPKIATFVPEDTPSFSLFHFETEDLVDTVLDCLSTIDASAAKNVRGMLRMAQAQMNVDIEGEVLGALGRRFVALQWPSTTSDFAVVVSLRNPLAISQALVNTRMFRKSVTDGFEIFRAEDGAGSIAIGEGNLVLSSSDSRLREILEHAKSGKPNAQVARLIENAPTGTTSLSLTAMDTMFEGYLTLLDQFGPTNPAMAGLTRHAADVLPALGELTTTMTTDAEGLSVHSHSPLGSIGTVMALGATAAASMAVEFDPTLASNDVARRAEFAWRLGEIAAAVRESDAVSLDAAVRAGDLDTDLVGESTGRGDFVTDGYRFTLFRESADGPFAVIAWPDEELRGDVYACTEDCAPLVNEILTRSAGLKRPTLRDLYFEGRFGEALMTGWKHIAVVDVAQAETADAVELTGEDWNKYQLLTAAAEGTLKLDHIEIVRYLRSPHPVVVGQAAATAAKLGIRAAIPTMSEIALDADAKTRRQLAKAMLDLDDESARPIMRDMLRDPDGIVRAIAAAFAGRNKDEAASEALLDIVVRENPTLDDKDRMQALISLADLGDAACLDVAIASPTVGEEQGQAVAYLLQQLSPELGADAECTLLLKALPHQSKIVRRYAIQRLGELRASNATAALEGRLGNETKELRPLIEVSLSAIRGTSSGPASTEKLADAANGVQAWFENLDKDQRNMMIAGVAGIALVFAGGMLWLMMRRRRSTTDWAAMTAPSEDAEAEFPVEGEYGADEYYDETREHPDVYDEPRAEAWGEDPDHAAFEDYEFAEDGGERPRP